MLASVSKKIKRDDVHEVYCPTWRFVKDENCPVRPTVYRGSDGADPSRSS